MNKKIVLLLSFILVMSGCANETQTIQNDGELLDKGDTPFSLEIGDEITVNCAHLSQGQDLPLISIEDMEANEIIFSLEKISCSPDKKAKIFDKKTYNGEKKAFQGIIFFGLDFQNGVKGYLTDLFIKEFQEQERLKEGKELGWLEITEFKGQGTKTTSPFEIGSEAFYLFAFYSTSEDKAEYSKISTFVYRMSDDNLVSSFDLEGANCIGDILGCINSEGTYVYEGNNEYYLKVIATNLEEWSIVVREKYNP